MSNDEKWLDLGVGELLGIEDEIDYFNEHAPYGHNHRKPVDIHWAFEKSEALLVAELEEAAFRDLTRDNIRRLFKPIPHLG